MSFLKHMPIKRKVTFVILLISTAALMLAAGGIFIFQLFAFRQTFVRDLSALGQIIAQHSAAPLAFNDKQAANEMLSALKFKPHVTEALLRLKDGTLFAHYGQDSQRDSKLPAGDGVHFQGRYLIYCKQIQLENETLGVLFLRADYRHELVSLLELYGGILAIVVTLSIGMTALLTSRLQRVISEPILKIAYTAKLVAENKDYSVRATKLENDEIGQLTDAFNQMLEQIHTGNLALRASQQKFETLVNSIEGVVWEADPKTLQFLFVSNQAERLFGYPACQWLEDQSFWRDHLYPEDRDKVLQTTNKCLPEKESSTLEYRMVGPGGSIFWVRSYAAVVLENDRPVLLRGVLLNVTEEKLASEQLAALQAKLLETSRRAGMAEVATGVLHNVGNVLNSVNVSTTLAADLIRKSEATTLARVAGLLLEHQNDLADYIANHPKGKLVPGFIHKLSEQWLRENQRTLAELQLLAKNVDHIKQIVAMQQSYARLSGMIEPLPIVQLLEDAIQINTAGFQRHGINVVRQFEPVPPVMVDRHKVLQILINLLRNAKYALEENSAAQKELTLGISMNGNNRIIVRVQDNGIGIAPENLTRIFGHGFTTKKDGHGFGLHSGALAANEMGGSLRAQSEGLGRGATFFLELPIAQTT